MNGKGFKGWSLFGGENKGKKNKDESGLSPEELRQRRVDAEKLSEERRQKAEAELAVATAEALEAKVERVESDAEVAKVKEGEITANYNSGLAQVVGIFEEIAGKAGIEIGADVSNLPPEERTKKIMELIIAERSHQGAIYNDLMVEAGAIREQAQKAREISDRISLPKAA